MQTYFKRIYGVIEQLFLRTLVTLRKIPNFHQISWFGNFVERQSFCRVSGGTVRSVSVVFIYVQGHHSYEGISRTDNSIRTYVHRNPN